MLDIFDNSSNNGFTRGIEVGGFVKELGLGAEAINGGSDTMKSIVMQEDRNKEITEKNERERERYYERNSVLIDVMNQIQVPIYIKVTRSVNGGTILTDSKSVSPKLSHVYINSN